MRKHILFEDENEGPEWVVTYHTGYSDFDDEIEDSDVVEIVLNAYDFDTAVKYAQQYLRKMKTDEDSSEEWQNASILSIELR